MDEVAFTQQTKQNTCCLEAEQPPLAACESHHVWAAFQWRLPIWYIDGIHAYLYV